MRRVCNDGVPNQLRLGVCGSGGVILGLVRPDLPAKALIPLVLDGSRAFLHLVHEKTRAAGPGREV